MIFRILGGTQSIRKCRDQRIVIESEGSVDPATFLQGGHLWVYSHAEWWKETACIAMIEAMACGLPSLVTSAGGMREYMVHGRTGFSCANTAEFLNFTELLLENQTLRECMAREARDWAATYFSLGALTSRLRCLFS